jgi:hypothetical protein
MKPVDDDDIPFEADGDDVRFETARDGDQYMCPFQCDLCHFRNIQKRDPGIDPKDKFMLVCVRRANLDALWAREPGTVKGNLREHNRAMRGASRLGIADPHPFARGPFPVKDLMGMAMACTILERSLDPGKNSATIEFGTLRKQRAYYSNYVHSSAVGLGIATLAGDKGKQFFTNSPTYTMWFERFMLGCHKRMGDVVCQDRALTIKEVLAIQDVLEEEWSPLEAKPSEKNKGRRLEIALLGMAVTAGFSGALRGEEIPKSDLAGCLKHRRESAGDKERPHVTLALRGRFKGETGEKFHLIPLVAESKSKIKNKVWFDRVMDLYEAEGVRNGPVFRVYTRRGKLRTAKIADLDPLFHDTLRKVQELYPELISSEIDVAQEYSLQRSLRRGSTTHAGNQRVPPDVVNMNNRWRSQERAGGCRPTYRMIEHYTDIKAALPSLLRYSEAL